MVHNVESNTGNLITISRNKKLVTVGKGEFIISFEQHYTNIFDFISTCHIRHVYNNNYIILCDNKTGKLTYYNKSSLMIVMHSKTLMIGNCHSEQI